MINDHITRIKKAGAIITAVDPTTKSIVARLAGAQDVPVNAFTYDPIFRWPMVGEEWLLKEENGSWFLDTIIEEQNKGKNLPAPGDTVISASSGTVWLNKGGVLTPLVEHEERNLSVKDYVEDPAAKGHVLQTEGGLHFPYELKTTSGSRFVLVTFEIHEAGNFAELILEGKPVAITERSGSVGTTYRTTLTVVIPPNKKCHVQAGFKSGGGASLAEVAIEHLWESVS